jgi:predicted ATP-grasp superfamily ATP-dependent carboligase
MMRGMSTVLADGGPCVLIHEHASGGGMGDDPPPASWLAEGSAMRRALAADFAALGARVVMTLDARLPDEHGPWTTVRIRPLSILDALPSLTSHADHTVLIAPETGGILRDLARMVARAGGRSLGSIPEAIDLTSDKLRLAEHLDRAGVPTPATRLVRPGSGLPRDAIYPAVLKPVDGAGSIDTLMVTSPEDPIVAAFSGATGLLQPLSPGEPRSASFLARPDAPPRLLAVGRQEIAVESGRFAYLGGTILTDELPADHPARRSVASVPGLAGLVGVDYLHDPESGRATVLEINPRPTTSCIGLVHALGPGRLASTWLSMAARSPASGCWSQARQFRIVSFRADGTVFHDPNEALSYPTSR